MPVERVALFIVGEPGIGKTTLVRRLLARGGESFLVQKPKWTVVEGKMCAAGHYVGGTFDGADTVPYNGVADALAFRDRELRHLPLTIFDGDRFSFAGAVDKVRASGARVRAMLIEGAPELAAARRAARGSKQNPTWLAGRKTKALRFAESLGAERLRAAETPEALEAALWRLLG